LLFAGRGRDSKGSAGTRRVRRVARAGPRGVRSVDDERALGRIPPLSAFASP
jgi:hypothetical protein